MRISDWSSDVCSSDLIDAKYDRFVDAFGTDVASQRAFQNTPKWTLSGTLGAHIPVGDGAVDASTSLSYRSLTHQFEVPRSEEHTSELQSLMRISYAVFCLKKKNNKTSVTYI